MNIFELTKENYTNLSKLDKQDLKMINANTIILIPSGEESLYTDKFERINCVICKNDKCLGYIKNSEFVEVYNYINSYEDVASIDILKTNHFVRIMFSQLASLKFDGFSNTVQIKDKE